MTRGELIEALGCAREGTEELDGEIHYLVLQPRWDRDPPPPGAVEQFKRCADPYTRSVDVALRLVPAGFVCRVSTGSVHITARTLSSEASATLESADNRYGGVAKTPALAVCIAALRAKDLPDRSAAE